MKITLPPQFLTVEKASELKNNEALIVKEPYQEMATFGKEKKECYRLEIELAENKQRAVLTPNYQSLAAMMESWGDDSVNWVGKRLTLQIIKNEKGQKMIMAKPTE